MPATDVQSAAYQDLLDEHPLQHNTEVFRRSTEGENSGGFVAGALIDNEELMRRLNG